MGTRRTGRQESWGPHVCSPTIDDIWCALDGPIRRDLIEHLASGAKNVTTLAKELELDAPTVSSNLLQLWNAGLVDFDRSQQKHIYHLTDRIRVLVNANLFEIHCWTSNDDVLKLQLRRNSSTRGPHKRLDTR